MACCSVRQVQPRSGARLRTWLECVVAWTTIIRRAARFYGGLLVLGGSLQVGELFAFIYLLSYFFEPVQQLSQLYNLVQQSGAALHKLFELLDTQPSITEQPQEFVSTCGARAGRPARNGSPPGANGASMNCRQLRYPAGSLVGPGGSTQPVQRAPGATPIPLLPTAALSTSVPGPVGSVAVALKK